MRLTSANKKFNEISVIDYIIFPFGISQLLQYYDGVYSAALYSSTPLLMTQVLKILKINKKVH